MRSTLYSTGTTSSYYEEDATESLDFEETGNYTSIITGVTDGVDDEGKNHKHTHNTVPGWHNFMFI